MVVVPSRQLRQAILTKFSKMEMHHSISFKNEPGEGQSYALLMLHLDGCATTSCATSQKSCQ
jgi:hypothetical protein